MALELEAECWKNGHLQISGALIEITSHLSWGLDTLQQVQPCTCRSGAFLLYGMVARATS